MKSSRVLIGANPMFGHVNTVLPIAQAARRAGHDVVVATGPDMVAHVRRHGVDAVAVGPTLVEARAAFRDEWLALFAGAADSRADTLVPFAHSWKPDLVVHEETELAAAVAAMSVGARHVVHGLGLTPPLRIWEALAPRLDDLGRRWGVPNTSQRFADATYLDICPPALQPGYDSLWATVQPMRPTALTADAPDADPLDADPLDDFAASISALPYDRTIHITLGTVFNEGNPVLGTAIASLRDLGVNIVATTGPGNDPGRLGAQPRHVMVVPYVEHARLLPRCALVVSQGGAGVMFAALGHGLPQLVLPQGADQFANAEACARAGAGLALAGAPVAGHSITDAVRTLLDDPAYFVAAGRVRAQIEVMPSVDDVLAIVTDSQKVCLQGGAR